MQTDGRGTTEVVTVQQAAAILACCEDTILALIRSHKLVAFKVGARWRIHREDLNAYRRAQSNRPPPSAADPA